MVKWLFLVVYHCIASVPLNVVALQMEPLCDILVVILTQLVTCFPLIECGSVVTWETLVLTVHPPHNEALTHTLDASVKGGIISTPYALSWRASPNSFLRGSSSFSLSYHSFMVYTFRGSELALELVNLPIGQEKLKTCVWPCWFSIRKRIFLFILLLEEEAPPCSELFSVCFTYLPERI